MSKERLEEILEELANPKNVSFKTLLEICMELFDVPRIKGSHHVFKMPWPGDPRINIQRDGKDAKPYQVKDVVKAVKKLLEGENDG